MKEMFIYVFTHDAYTTLLSLGYDIVKIDERNNVFVFYNNKINCFDINQIECVFSNTLSL